MVIRIATLNTRGGDTKTPHIIKMIMENKIDICMLQEIHDMKKENMTKIQSETKMTFFKSSGSNNGRGVITMIKESSIIQRPNMVYKDTLGNQLVVAVEIESELFEIVNIYGPIISSQRSQLYETLNNDTEGKDNRIIGGDFNNFENFNLDCTGGSIATFEKRKKERRTISLLREKHKYIDTFRHLHPTKRSFTFSGISNYRSRLDRIYIHQSTSTKIILAEMKPAYFSDHDMYIIEQKTSIETERITWGKGLWKYNKTTLENKTNAAEMKSHWDKYRTSKNRYKNLLEWWEIGKRSCKQKCIDLSKLQLKDDAEVKEKLKIKLNEVCRSTDAKSSVTIRQIKKQLNEIEENETEGALIRSRLQWQNEGEKCTNYFFNLERRKGAEKQIHKLTDNSGKVYETKDDVVGYMKNFYEHKFEKSQLDDVSCDVLLDSVICRLTNAQRESQAGPFTLQELECVKTKMKPGKSPGNDGLTYEFYHQCWNFIRDDLLQVINEISASGYMPISMTQAIVTLIYKNKGDRTRLENWRAISLCNVDFKFLTAMIAGRIEPYLPTLIEPDQSCGIRGRVIEDQLIYIQDLIHYIKQFGGRSIIIGLDLQSAFDFINHTYIFKLLQRLNFASRLRNLVKTVFRNMYSAVIVNGTKTRYFQLSRSIRQGDKASMACFLLAIEPLANIIRRDRKMHPIVLPNSKPKLVSLYCDDTNVFSTDINDVGRLSNHMQTFESGAGAKFNIEKTEIHLIGNWNQKEKEKIPAAQNKVSVKILGVWFGSDSKRLNSEQIINKIDSTLNFWKTIPLSFDGKRLIIMTKVLPKLYHVVRITGIDETLRKQVQKRMNEFFWHPKKMSMIAFDTLQNTKLLGGLDMPNLHVINKALLTERISKMMTSEHIWSGQFIFRLGFSLRDLDVNFASSKYSHTLKQTEVTSVILDTYRALKGSITDWSSENFKTLKLKLHKNNKIKKADPTRDYTNTWTEIHTSTDNRRRRDISFLIAHDALPVAYVLWKRKVVTNAKCRLCGKSDETREHLFIHCHIIQPLMKILNKVFGRTLSEEEILYHEGRITMKKKMKNLIAKFKQCIWQTRAKLYYGEISNELEMIETMIYIFKSNNQT